MSLLVGVVCVSVLGDMETPPGLPVPPAAVGVGVTTWAVFVGPSTVLMNVLAVKVEVSILVDVGTSPGVPVLLPVVGADVSTCVVSVFPCASVHAEYVNQYNQYPQLSVPQCSGLESTNLEFFL